jgi:flagellar FliJ protein
MSPSKRLKPVQKVAGSREKTAAKQFGDSQRNLNGHVGKLEELRQYHQEYIARFQQAMKSGISSAQLQEYRAFIAKLNEAIQQQEQVVASSQLERTSKQNSWQKKHTRVMALGKVVDRYKKEEAKTADKKEQSEDDERSQRAHGRR